MVNLGGLQDLRGYTTAPARSNGVGAVAVPAALAAGELAKKVDIMPFGLRQLKQPVQYPNLCWVLSSLKKSRNSYLLEFLDLFPAKKPQPLDPSKKPKSYQLPVLLRA